MRRVGNVFGRNRRGVRGRVREGERVGRNVWRRVGGVSGRCGEG